MKQALLSVVWIGILVAGCCRDKGTVAWEKLNQQAAQEYLEPVRPGYEGRNPYWNGFAKKFIYAPAFGFADVPGAVKYRFQLSQEEGDWSFEAERPCEPLSKVWNEIPVGKTQLIVLALDASEAGKAIEILAAHGDKATIIGEVTGTPGVAIELL